MFYIYAAAAVFTSALVYIIGKVASGKRRSLGPSSKDYRRCWRKVHRFCFPCLSGVLGAQSVIFAKSLSELIKYSFEVENQFLNIEAWAIFLMMCFLVFSQLHFLAVSLQYFDAVYVVPTFQGFFIIMSIVGGAVYFDEFRDFDTNQIVYFSVGLFVTILGVAVLSARGSGVKKTPRQRIMGATYVLFERCVTNPHHSLVSLSIFTNPHHSLVRTQIRHHFHTSIEKKVAQHEKSKRSGR